MASQTSFKLFSHVSLSEKDHQVLSLLYLPLIGGDAFSLYYLLLRLEQDVIIMYEMIQDILNVKKQRLNKIKHHLEAIGLLDVYEKDDVLHFVLKQPLSAKQFLTDTLLGSYLESEIGHVQLQKLLSYFKVEPDFIATGKRITRSFDDVYEAKQLDLLKLDQTLANGYVGNVLIKKQFSLEQFVNMLPDRLKHPKLFTQRYQESLAKLAYIYDLSIEDLVSVYTKSTKGEPPTEAELNFKARQLFQKTAKVLEKPKDDQAFLQNATPKDIITLFSDEKYQGEALQISYEFTQKNDIDNGILNTLLMFILKNKQGRLPHVNYLDKVYKSWQQKGVITLEDALNHIKNVESTYNSSNTKFTQKVVKPKPEWLDKYLQELDEWEG